MGKPGIPVSNLPTWRRQKETLQQWSLTHVLEDHVDLPLLAECSGFGCGPLSVSITLDGGASCALPQRWLALRIHARAGEKDQVWPGLRRGAPADASDTENCIARYAILFRAQAVP